MVAGVQYAPVIRPGRLPVVDGGTSDASIDEADRPAEAARFGAAATAVATRLRDRAAHATGAASEVLAATATLAQDRAWLGAAEKRIKEGTPAARAVAAAVEQFVAMFTQLGGLIGQEGALAIQGLLKSASEPAKSTIASIISIITLIVGATSICAELQSDLDRIWRVPGIAKPSVL